MPDWLTTALAVLGGIATAYGLWAGGRKALADARATGRPGPPSWPEVWERMDKQDEKIATLEGKVTALQQTEGRLVGWVARLHHGISDGSIPPLPDIPDWLLGLLSRRPHDD